MIRPASAARIAWWSELLPSVAETLVCASCLNVYGSEPLWRTNARFFAWMLDPAVIWAPFPGGIPRLRFETV